MTNGDAKIVDLSEFSGMVYAVCNEHIDLYPDDQVHGRIFVDGPWQCDNCPEDCPPAVGTVYVVSE